MSLDINYDAVTHVLSINLEPAASEFDLPDGYYLDRVIDGLTQQLKSLPDNVTVEFSPLRGGNGVVPFADGEVLILDMLTTFMGRSSTETPPKIESISLWQNDIEPYLQDFSDELVSFCTTTGIALDFYDIPNEVDFHFAPTGKSQDAVNETQQTPSIVPPGFGFGRA